MRLLLRLLGAAGIALVAAGPLAQVAPTGATFANASNGLIAFSSTRSNAEISGGSNLYLVNQAAVKTAGASDTVDPADTTDLTATAFDDHQPFFSGDGQTVVFASDRGGSFKIWKVAASNVPTAADVTGTTSPAADGAVLVTPSTEANDCWPSLNATGTTLAYVHGAVCNGGSGSSSEIETLNLTTPSATPQVVVSGGVLGDRPVFDPVDSTQLLYVATGTAGSESDLVLLDNVATPSQSATDLSQASAVGTNGDEHPDWAPNGQEIVFDSNRPIDAANSNDNVNQLWVMTSAGASAVPVYVQGSPAVPTYTGQTDFEPVFSPDGTQLALARIVIGQNVYDTDMVKLDSSYQIVVPSGKTPDQMGSDLTLDSQVESGGVQQIYPTANEPNWQGASPAAVVPETPWVIALPISGAALLGVAFILSRRRRRPTVSRRLS